MSKKKIGIIDIGSNTVRLVIYDPPYKSDNALLNEKVMCSLGQDILQSGILHPAGKDITIQTLQKFVKILRQHNVDRFKVIATAALRDAKDGAAFAQNIKAQTGLDVDIISGEQEALYSAQGILGAYPDVDGVMGDLGGGSLELAHVKNGEVYHPISLPLGVLRIQNKDNILHNVNLGKTNKNGHYSESKNEDWRGENFGKANEKLQRPASNPNQRYPNLNLHYIKSSLNEIPTPLIGHHRFYAVGGTWRALGIAYAIEYGLDADFILHNALGVKRIVEFIKKLMGVSARTLTEKYQVEGQRTTLLPIAAALLPLLLEKLGSAEIIFSPTSLREGVLVEMLKS